MLAIGLSGLFCQQINARPIVGSIDFGGVVTYGDTTGANTTSLATAARVNIWNSSFVLQDSLDFSSIAPGTNVSMAAPWIFNPSTDTPSLWTVGGFTFELTSSTVVREDSKFLNITGTGTVSSLNASVTGLDPTPGVWTFSSSNSNGSNSTTFGFQATTDPVPEASTMTLLAIGGFGFAALRFFRRTLRIKTTNDTEDFLLPNPAFCRTMEKINGFSKMLLAFLAIALAGVLFCADAQAVPIQGTIDFSGVVTFDTMSLATAKRVNQWQPFQNGPAGFSMVLQDSGDFSSIAAGTQAAMATPWIFNPSTMTPSLWSVGGFTFKLASSNIVRQDATFLDVEGVGTITSTNSSFDPTPGTWSFTSSDSNGQNQTTFSFQAHSAAVPEANTTVLFGIGGAGLLAGYFLRRKFKAG
jgi:hypothetical protein